MSTTREKMIERAATVIAGCEGVCSDTPINCQRMMKGKCFCMNTAAAVIDAIGAAGMAEALEPFEKLAEVLGVYSDSVVIDHSRDRKITLGDLRRARAALAKATGGEHE